MSNYGVSAEQWAAMSPVERHSAIVESAARVDDGWWVRSTVLLMKGYGQVIEQVDADRVKVEWRGGEVECEWRDELEAIADDEADLPG